MCLAWWIQTHLHVFNVKLRPNCVCVWCDELKPTYMYSMLSYFNNIIRVSLKNIPMHFEIKSLKKWMMMYFDYCTTLWQQRCVVFSEINYVKPVSNISFWCWASSPCMITKFLTTLRIEAISNTRWCGTNESWTEPETLGRQPYSRGTLFSW